MDAMLRDPSPEYLRSFLEWTRKVSPAPGLSVNLFSQVDMTSILQEHASLLATKYSFSACFMYPVDSVTAMVDLAETFYENVAGPVRLHVAQEHVYEAIKAAMMRWSNSPKTDHENFTVSFNQKLFMASRRLFRHFKEDVDSTAPVRVEV